jgi:hypothetical protein
MEKKQINIGIKKIKEIEFFINENFPLVNPSEFNISFQINNKINPEDNTVELNLSAIFSDIAGGDIFMRIKTNNIFIILELASLHDPKNNTFNIPDNIIITMLSLSISHTRALLAKNASGTKFSELYIPIVNPSEVFNQLYGKK